MLGSGGTDVAKLVEATAIDTQTGDIYILIRKCRLMSAV
jgi:hypothetical protein